VVSKSDFARPSTGIGDSRRVGVKEWQLNPVDRGDSDQPKKQSFDGGARLLQLSLRGAVVAQPLVFGG
jgi:hypothetical protein